jgi:beta-xylosidase
MNFARNKRALAGGAGGRRFRLPAVRPWLAAALIIILLLSACADPTENQAAGTPPADEPPATIRETASDPEADFTPAAPDTGAPEAVAENERPQPGVTFRNPVFNLDFPDPHIIRVDDLYYGYATNSAGRNIQVATSPDLVNWTLLRDALPGLPRWAGLRGGLVWAPEVIQIGDQFLMYYTVRDRESDRQCIGLAVSEQPQGPFLDTRAGPFVCQAELGGSIDASPFLDGDTLYLLWKNDGNCCGRATWIFVQEMTPDGQSLVGEPVQLIRNERAWEGHVIEAPTMYLHPEEGYFLFYSANNYGGPEYAVGYAICETVTGPCEKAPENPILSTVLEPPLVLGPGHQTLVETGGQLWIVYHAWEVTPGGMKTDRRQMWLDRLDWEDGRPVVRGPTTGVQPVPEVD